MVKNVLPKEKDCYWFTLALQKLYYGVRVDTNVDWSRKEKKKLCKLCRVDKLAWSRRKTPRDELLVQILNTWKAHTND